jgi:hypothetical protein
MRGYQQDAPDRAGGPGRAEIARAVPGASRRLRGRRIEKTYLDALTVQPQLLQLRADARANTLEVAKQLARHASYQDGTTRPTRARICQLARLCESAWKAARRRLETWGFLGTVTQGTTPEFSPMALADPDGPNTAAVYVICIPRAVPSPQVTTRTRPPTPSSLLEGFRAPRARRRNPPKPEGPACGRAHPEAAAPGAATAMAGVLRQAAGQGITEGWCAWLARPFAAAGWSTRDVLWAIDHEPAGPQHRLSAKVRHPVGWLRWRLGQWLDTGSVALMSLSQVRAAARARARAAAAGLRELTGGRQAELAAVLEEQAAAVAAARAAAPSERAAQLRRRLNNRLANKETVMEFYDSTDPGKIPAHSRACLYYDGVYAATTIQAARFEAVRWITVYGNYSDCGIADYEEHNPVYDLPGALRGFVEGRLASGHRARVYCNRANLPKVRAQLEGLDYLVWLATLDGDKLSPGATPGLWAVQYAGGVDADYDTSILYGTW